MKSTRVATVGALLLAASIACHSRQTPASAGPDSGAAESNSSLVDHERAASVSELRAAHPEAADSEGTACADDRQCASPLRCLDHACFWPPALTGDRDGADIVAEIEGAEGELHSFFLELADEPWETTRGMMHRRSVAPGMGMLFDFETDGPRSFWMRNTFIPLDMLFVDSEGRVVSVIERAEPLTLNARRSTGPARFVIELVGGTLSRTGIRAGSTVRFAPAE